MTAEHETLEAQPGLVKETRIQLGQLCEASDCEVVNAALKFSEWAACLKADDTQKPVVTSTAHLDAVEMPESVDAQLCPGWPPATPPSHGRGWPQVEPPHPNDHVRTDDSESSQSAQCSKVAIDPDRHIEDGLHKNPSIPVALFARNETVRTELMAACPTMVVVTPDDIEEGCLKNIGILLMDPRDIGSTPFGVVKILPACARTLTTIAFHQIALDRAAKTASREFKPIPMSIAERVAAWEEYQKKANGMALQGQAG